MIDFNCQTCSDNYKSGAQRCGECCHYKKAHPGNGAPHQCPEIKQHTFEGCPSGFKGKHKDEPSESKKKRKCSLIEESCMYNCYFSFQFNKLLSSIKLKNLAIGNALKNAKSNEERRQIVVDRLNEIGKGMDFF